MKRVCAGEPPHEEDERSGPRWETGLGRVNGVAEVTPGHPKYVQGRTLRQQVRILQARREAALAESKKRLDGAGSEKERQGAALDLAQVERLNPAPSVQTLSSWRKAFLAGGMRVQALLDCDRHDKGGFRGNMASPEIQDLVVECERRLIVTSHREFPSVPLLRAKMLGRLGKARANLLPSEGTIDRFRRTAIPMAERVFLARGERGYREGPMPKPPAQLADQHGVVLIIDHKQSDVLVLWGEKEIRSWLTTATDPHSGACRGIHVSPMTPGSAEIALTLRDAIRHKEEDEEGLLSGIPSFLYTDQGKDMRSGHLQAALADLGISRILARPYSPWARGSAEGNLHGTISKRLEPDIPGYIGNDPKARPPGVRAVIRFEQYAVLIRRRVLVEFNQLVYQKRRLSDGRKASRLDFARANHVQARLPSDAALMLALLKRERRTVQPGGITLAGMFTYWHEALSGLAEERAQVEIRFDPSDMSAVEVFYKGEWYCTAPDPRAASVGATEGTARDRHRKRGERLKYLRAATREDRVAAMDGSTYLEYLKENEPEDVRAVASGGSPRPIRQMIPPLDQAAAMIRRGGRPAIGAKLPGRRLRESDWPDPYDKPVVEEREG